MNKKKILLIDDHKMVREGLKMALEYDNVFDIVGEANNGLEGIEKTKELKPDIIIMDIDMPQLNGIDASIKIREFDTDVKILILTMLSDEELVFKALSAGVDGYIYKMAEIKLFKEAVKSLAVGDTYFSQEVTNLVIKSHIRSENKSIQNELSGREIEVLKLIVDGLTSQQIADKLFISYFTVAKHRKNIGDKLGIKNTAGLIKYSIENNLV
ncbi:MAG: response regulator transcription factor [Ignavibacteria bacterium]|jgi:DNA-binding NarL/FixJ family response regulator